MTRMIRIFDTTLRDGEQSSGASMNVEEKVMVAKQLARLGVDIIEAGFVYSSPGDFEAVRRIAQEVEGPTICSLARARPEDIDRAWEALKGAPKVRIHTFFSTSDIHLKHQFRMTREQAKQRAVEMVQRARGYVDDVEFSPMDAGRSDPSFLYEVIEAVIAAGAGTVNIADTVGYAVPQEFGALIRGIGDKVPNAKQAVISVHCHNDLGVAVANSLAAIMNGAGQVECTINGIGERAGNTSLEEIVMGLRTRTDFYQADTRIRTEEIAKTSRLVSKITGIVVQPNKAIVGANAFSHTAGIHQQGLLKEKTTYEIMRPESIGLIESQMGMGKLSGRHAFRQRVEKLGYKLSETEVNHAFERFKKHADQKKEIVELRRKVTQLVTLHRSSLVCNSIVDRELLIKRALTAVVEDLHHECVCISFFDGQKQKLYGARLLGAPPDIATWAQSVQTSIIDPETIEGTVLLKGQPVLVNDIADAMDRLHPLHQHIVRRLGTKSFISVPMRADDRILGSVTVDRMQPDVLTQQDVEGLTTFANHLAITLNNIAAYTKIEALNAELEEKVHMRTAQLQSANERLMELDHLKSTFVSVVSHEVRTPMTAIRMQVENMLDGLLGSLNDEQVHSLNRILYSVERLTRLSTDLLDLAKIESGNAELRREPLQLKSVVDEIVDAYRYLLAEKSVLLEIAHADEAVTIFADRDKLVQIFTNLLSNALKFTSKGGTIRILTDVRPDGFASIRITDSGCGIAPDEIARVFEKFYRGVGIPSGARGAGLGLAIVKNLVELHGGTVGVDSTVGTGTSFFFTLPMTQASIMASVQ